MVGKVEVITVEHLEKIEIQDSQSRFREQLKDPAYRKAIVEAGDGFCYVEDGRVLACAGVFTEYKKRGIAWSFLSGGCGDRFVAIFRAIKGYLDLEKYERVAMHVDPEFKAGHRMAKMLGFMYEGTMRKYFEHGGDAVLYARVK